MRTKLAGLMISALALGGLSTTRAQTNFVPPAPALWLSFNNSLADHGTSTNVHAVSAQPDPGYDGHFTNDVANATCGDASLSLSGDGSFIEVTNVSDLNFDTGSPYSITAWIRTTNAGGVIAAKSTPDVITGGSGTLTPAFFVDESGSLRLDVFYVNTVLSSASVTGGNWTHVAVTYDGTTYRLYINGLPDGVGSFGGADEGANGEGPWAFTVGATLNGTFPQPNGVPGAPFDGEIDEVAVWHAALTPDQIGSVYSNGVPAITINVTQQPADVQTFGGLTGTFAVAGAPVGTSGPLQYQWQSNGVSIVLATNMSYTTPLLTASFNGAQYQCVVSAGPVSVLSRAATLLVTAPELPPTPLLWLPFNNSLADHGTSTNVHAVSSQPNPGYTGYFTNDVANATCGPASLSLAGDGSFVQLTNVSDLNFDTGSAYTITAWIRTTNAGGVIAAKSTPDVITGSTGTLTPAFFVDASGSLRIDVFYVNTVLSSARVTSGQWTHVAVTYDGATYRLYINGFGDGVGAFAGANEGANGEGPWAFTVGATLNGTFPQPNGVAGAPFNGEIDEVAVWTSALLPGQIYSVFHNGVEFTPPPSLNISRSGNRVTLSWTGTGYKLQQNSSLTNPAGWSDVAGGGASGGEVTIGAGNEFFRLVTQ